MLRDYQQNAVDAACNFYKYRKPLHGYVTAPGGSGKSHMIAAVAERIFDLGKRVCILARSEKLLSQNHSKFAPEYRDNIGVYCAGLGKRDCSRAITIASIQSIASEQIPVDCVIVDECDEISADEESQYQQFFIACGAPRILGFTATPFRTGSGKISWGEEIINIPLPPLMEAGYLAPPTNKVGATLDLSAVDVRLGEYVQAQLESIYDDPELLALSVRKIKQYSAERSCVLIFCQSLRHADILANAMEFNGMPCVTVSGDTDKDELHFILEDFNEGRIKYLINCMLITRGYDIPSVDMIAILRATKSKRLFEQMLYRGTRIKPGKQDFLVLDMGNNFATHGPLGSPHVMATNKREAQRSQGKICPECETFTPPLARECPDCGFQFPEPEKPLVNHAKREDTTSATVYAGDETAEPQIYDVNTVTYKTKKSKTGNEMLVVEYWCDGVSKYGSVCDYLLPFHDNEWVRGRVHHLFKQGGNELGSACSTYKMDDLLWHAQQLKNPDRVTVTIENGYQKVKERHYARATQQQEFFLDDELP